MGCFPLYLLSYRCESGKIGEDSLKLMDESFNIVKRSKSEEAIVNAATGKEQICIKRDYAGMVVKITDNTQERDFVVSIEYEERPSNDNLFGYKGFGLDFLTHGDVASAYQVPFFLFYSND